MQVTSTPPPVGCISLFDWCQIPARFVFQDKKDIEFACRAGVDWIAMSFVQTKDDMKELRERVQNHGFDEIPGCNNKGLIALENPTHSGKRSYKFSSSPAFTGGRLKFKHRSFFCHMTDTTTCALTCACSKGKLLFMLGWYTIILYDAIIPYIILIRIIGWYITIL